MKKIFYVQDGGITGGAETITVSNIDNGGIKHVVYVYHYSGSGTMCSAKAQVSVYPGNGQPGQTFVIPDNCNGAGDGAVWVVGCFDSDNGLGAFEVKNTIIADANDDEIFTDFYC